MEPIVEIQQTLKAPKGQYNSFGKYNYRSCEDIIEALKPIIHPMGFWLNISDQPEAIGDRVYIKATVTITNGEKSYTSAGYAREEDTKKGMDGSQITGAASSYARKYALNGLLAIDDNKDSDTSNKEKQPDPSRGEKKATLNQLHEKWTDAVDFMQKNGDISVLLDYYVISENDQNELKKHTPQS